jgi:hypothetical protein
VVQRGLDQAARLVRRRRGKGPDRVRGMPRFLTGSVISVSLWQSLCTRALSELSLLDRGLRTPWKKEKLFNSVCEKTSGQRLEKPGPL